MNKKCYINSDIILDFNSLVFSILKKQNPDLDFNLNDVQENPLKYLESLQLLEANLSILKPQIGAIETIEFLKSLNVEVILYSDLAQSINQHLPVYNIQEFKVDDHIKEDSIIIDPRLSFCEVLLNQKHHAILFKNHKLKDKQYWETNLSGKQIEFVESWEQFPWGKIMNEQQPNFAKEQYKVNEIENAATSYWNTSIKIQPIELQSLVIHGKNRGGTMLGIPTANLQITEEILLQTKPLLPGVYVGIAYLGDVKYGSVLSIGYNPYFLDTPLTIEVHLYNEFQQDFYGENLRLIITHFLRPESDFRNFNHLITAISNDKIIGRKLVA